MRLKAVNKGKSNSENRYFKYFLIIIFSLSLLTVKGQELSYTIWNTDNGLPSSIVNDIAQDKMGYIWLATDLGLCKFNGSNFIVFRKQEGLPESSITRILQYDGKLLFLTRMGWLFTMLDNKPILNFSANNLKAQLNDETIDNAVIDNNDVLWITTLGVVKFAGLDLRNGKAAAQINSGNNVQGSIWLKKTGNSFIWSWHRTKQNR
ncbi:MAG: hypothetical protein MZV63_26620 [Marinilabiliales bacterium]|nr:hypothetical protein [Marinilabiliales bacterium]